MLPVVMELLLPPELDPIPPLVRVTAPPFPPITLPLLAVVRAPEEEDLLPPETKASS